MLLKMLNDCDYAVQESNQIIAHIGTIDVVAPLTDETIRTYEEYRVTNIYPRSDGVYGVLFEIELPHLMMADYQPKRPPRRSRGQGSIEMRKSQARGILDDRRGRGVIPRPLFGAFVSCARKQRVTNELKLCIMMESGMCIFLH